MKNLRKELDDAFVFGVAVVIAAAFIACPKPTPDPTPPTPDANDSGPTGPVTCKEVCAHYRQLGCKEGDPTPKGATCEQVCDNFQTSGVAKWNLPCRLGVKSCAETSACEK